MNHYKYKMDRHVSSLSDQELVRRRTAAQKYMTENDIDCILMFGFESKQGGAIRYFCDWPADFCHYGSFLLVPKEGEMALFAHGPFMNKAMPYGERGLELNFGSPFTPMWLSAKDYFPPPAVKWLKKRGYKKLGIYHKNMVPFYFTDYIMKNLEGATLTGVDDGLDAIRAIKSEEELALIREAVQIHDRIYAAAPIFLRPGRLERDVATELKKAAWDLGAEGFNIRICTDPQKAKHKIFEFQNSVIQEGDVVDLRVQVCAPGSYWGDLSRMWVVYSDPSDALQKANSDSVKMQNELAKLAVPNAKASELISALHKFQEENGYRKEAGFFGNGQGTDIVERPAFLPEETMLLQENMLISLGIGMENDETWAFNADNFLITKNGAVRLNETAQGLFTNTFTTL
ncbi:MAG: M24 family metallopeptidase [Oscillospiraceae bacterium]|nr:M24 family metallopeptidase [Oscillospiraceae bacterium]